MYLIVNLYQISLLILLNDLRFVFGKEYRSVWCIMYKMVYDIVDCRSES